jgi:hypothetical protein
MIAIIKIIAVIRVSIKMIVIIRTIVVIRVSRGTILRRLQLLGLSWLFVLVGVEY